MTGDLPGCLVSLEAGNQEGFGGKDGFGLGSQFTEWAAASHT